MLTVRFGMQNSVEFSMATGLIDSSAHWFTAGIFLELSQERACLMQTLNKTERNLQDSEKELRSIRIEEQPLMETMTRLKSKVREAKAK